MRKAIIIACAVLFGAACIGGPVASVLVLQTSTNTYASGTLGGEFGFEGFVEQIDVAAGSMSQTGVVDVAYDPIDGVTRNVVLATNTVAGAKTFRPRVDCTGTDGAALTSDPPGRYALCREQVRVSVVSSPTGATWHVTLRLDK